MKELSSPASTARFQPVLPLVLHTIFGLLTVVCVLMYALGTDGPRGAAFIGLPLNLIGMVATWIWEELIRLNEKH